MAVVNGEAGFTQLPKLNVTDAFLLRGVPFESTSALNVITINALTDFPAPVNGVIELSGGVNKAYLIAATEVDISPNVLAVTGGNVYIRGYHPGESEIITDSSTPLFTTSQGSIRLDSLILNSPNANTHDFSGNSFSSSLIMDNCLIRDCKYIAQNITGAVATSLNRVTVLSTTVGGLTFSGAGNSQILINNCAVGLSSGFLGWTGDFIDLLSATFDLISINGNRCFPGAGDTFLTGQANGANMKTGGSAEVAGNLFSGVGSSITVITGQDDNWLFTGNNFNDGVMNTSTSADAYLVATETVTINTIGAYEFIGGVNWQSDNQDHFTVSNSGIIESTNLIDSTIEILATATIEKVGGGADNLCAKIAIDGIVQDKTIACTDNPTPSSVTCHGLFNINGGLSQQIRLYVSNSDSTANIIVSTANISVKGI